jgi:hypothetical protein
MNGMNVETYERGRAGLRVSPDYLAVIRPDDGAGQTGKPPKDGMNGGMNEGMAAEWYE